MQPDRETVYGALNTVLSDALTVGSPPSFVTVDRKILTAQNFSRANQPGLFQVQKSETYTARKGVPPVRKFLADLVIYNYTGQDNTAIPSAALNGLVTAVENALAPNVATAFQQLGVPVSSCIINGTIEYFEGVLGVWAVAVVPVEIIANY